MATPHVSGAAALLLSACALNTTALLKSALMTSVDPVAAYAGRTVTGGRLNVNTAIRVCPPRRHDDGGLPGHLRDPERGERAGAFVQVHVDRTRGIAGHGERERRRPRAGGHGCMADAPRDEGVDERRGAREVAVAAAHGHVPGINGPGRTVSCNANPSAMAARTRRGRARWP